MPHNQHTCARLVDARDPLLWRPGRGFGRRGTRGRPRRRAGKAQDGDPGNWIATWATSPQPWWDADFFVPIEVPRSLRDQTVRQIARVSLGGSRVRVELSNEYGRTRS